MNLLEKIKLLYLLNKLAQEVMNVKNWKTTLFGALTAAGAGMAQFGEGTVAIIGKILVGLGPLLMGLFAKDNNVTGGTVQQ